MVTKQKICSSSKKRFSQSRLLERTLGYWFRLSTIWNTNESPGYMTFQPERKTVVDNESLSSVRKSVNNDITNIWNKQNIRYVFPIKMGWWPHEVPGESWAVFGHNGSKHSFFFWCDIGYTGSQLSGNTKGRWVWFTLCVWNVYFIVRWGVAIGIQEWICRPVL